MMTSGGFNPQDAISQWQNGYDGGTKVRPPIDQSMFLRPSQPIPQMGGGGGFQQIPFNWINSMKPPQPAPQQSSWGVMPGSANNYGHGFTPGGEIYKGMGGGLLGAPPRPPMMGGMMNSIFGSMQPQRPQPMPAQPPAPGMPLPPSGRSTLTGYYG